MSKAKESFLLGALFSQLCDYVYTVSHHSKRFINYYSIENYFWGSMWSTKRDSLFPSQNFIIPIFQSMGNHFCCCVANKLFKLITHKLEAILFFTLCLQLWNQVKIHYRSNFSHARWTSTIIEAGMLLMKWNFIS